MICNKYYILNVTRPLYGGESRVCAHVVYVYMFCDLSLSLGCLSTSFSFPCADFGFLLGSPWTTLGCLRLPWSTEVGPRSLVPGARMTESFRANSLKGYDVIYLLSRSLSLYIYIYMCIWIEHKSAYIHMYMCFACCRCLFCPVRFPLILFPSLVHLHDNIM